MKTNPQRHTPPRWRRQEGRNEGGCILFLIVLGLFVICSIIGRINSCRTRSVMEEENRNTAERLRADNLAANIRAEEQHQVEEKQQQAKQQVLNYALGLTKSPPPARLTQPYIRGKQVVVSGDTDEDYSTKKKTTNYTLKTNEADSLNEVGTVVVLRYYDVTAGDYIERGTGAIETGYRQDCEVTIIDNSIPAVIYRKTMRGKPPGLHVTRYNYGTIRGDAPDVDGFLKSLPRR